MQDHLPEYCPDLPKSLLLDEVAGTAMEYQGHTVLVVIFQVEAVN